jgi:uncharacterized protein (TIGR02145 family)
MLSPRLTNCPECANIPNLIEEIDCKLAYYANGLFNNITFMLNQSVPAGIMIQLIAYRRILTYKNANPDYICEVSINRIASKVKLLTLGCNTICVLTPTPTSSTTSTSSTSTTTTTTTTLCGTLISEEGGQGAYLVNLDVGNSIGAIIVKFNPGGLPDGIKATYNGLVYNKLTSPVDGLHQSSNASNFTFIGNTIDDCGISGTTYPALQEFLYSGTAFVATGNTQSVTVAAGDVSLSATDPGTCIMVIPKTTASPSIINFEIIGPCSETGFGTNISCPVLLTGFSSSSVFASSTLACAAGETQTYYNASLNDTPGIVDVFDFVYSDNLGVSPLANGFYNATGSIAGGAQWFQVVSGIVVAINECNSTSTSTTTAVPTTTTTTTVQMVWTYTFRYITCDTCANFGSGSFGNSQELTVGNYYITPSGPYKLLILGFVSVNPGSPAHYILNSSGSTTCEGISCPTTTTTTTVAPTTTTTTTAVASGTVTICNQTWTSTNLDTTTYRNGDTIPQVTDPTQWAALTTGAWCYYNNDSGNGTTYGKLYNWYAVNDPRGLAPLGYHIPSYTEWITLFNCLGNSLIAGGKMKETGTLHWNTPNTAATNSSGFTALPGGFKYNTSGFNNIGNNGFWWSSSENTQIDASSTSISHISGNTFGNPISKAFGLSVRCIKD